MRNKKFVFMVLIVVIILGCSEFPDLGNGYKLDYNTNNDIYILNSENTIIINGHILKYNFDSVYIIAEQKPRKVILKDTYDNTNMDFKKREKIFKESSFRQYWIINKINDSICGPLNKDDYLKKFDELGVTKELQLKE